MSIYTDPSWDIYLDDPSGNLTAILDDHAGFTLVRSANNVGSFSLKLPGNFDDRLLVEDALIEFWRKSRRGYRTLESVCLVRGIEPSEDEDGLDVIEISGPDAMDLLNTRIVAYPAESAQSSKSAPADDLIKAVVRENLGSLAIAARSLDSLGFIVESDTSAAPAVNKSFAWRNVLATIRDISDAAHESGTDVYYIVKPYILDGGVSFIVGTRTGYISRDHSLQTGSNYVVFSETFQNLARPRLILDYRDEINYIYSGGQNQGEDRFVVEVSDPARVNASPWNRRESFVDSRNYSDAAAEDRAYTELARSRPRLRFSADLLDTDLYSYGDHWTFGDKVTVQFRDYEFHSMISAVRFSVKDDTETLEAKLEYLS